MKTRNGLFADVPENLWNDWHWQVANRAETVEDLKKYMNLTPDEEEGVRKTLGKLRMAVTPYYLSLIDLDDPFDPIRKMAIPRAEELEYADLLLHVIDISDPHWLEQAQIVDELNNMETGSRQVMELLEDKGADAAAVPVRMHRQLIDEHRAHVALLEVARVDPVVRAGHLVGAFGVGHDVPVDLEEQLLHALFLVDLLEAMLGARPLVLDGLAVDVAEADLQELPDAVDVAAVDAGRVWLDGALKSAIGFLKGLAGSKA